MATCPARLQRPRPRRHRSARPSTRGRRRPAWTAVGLRPSLRGTSTGTRTRTGSDGGLRAPGTVVQEKRTTARKTKKKKTVGRRDRALPPGHHQRGERKSYGVNWWRAARRAGLAPGTLGALGKGARSPHQGQAPATALCLAGRAPAAEGR